MLIAAASHCLGSGEVTLAEILKLSQLAFAEEDRWEAGSEAV
jgi:hypothetical protein